MDNDKPDHAPAKKSRAVWIFYTYLGVMLAGCFYPARTGIFTLRTKFNIPMYDWMAPAPLQDIVINLLMYIPVGILLMVIARKRASLQGAIFRAILLGTGISVGVEFVQYFITDRVSSALDVALNFGGTSIGVLVAVVLEKLTRPRDARITSSSSSQD